MLLYSGEMQTLWLIFQNAITVVHTVPSSTVYQHATEVFILISFEESLKNTVSITVLKPI